MASLPFEESEYRGRQSRFLAQIPLDNLVLIPTNPTSVWANDVHYPYLASSYMLYLCGWADSGCVMMAKHNGDDWIISLFVQPNDTTSEIWEGRRIGVDDAASGWPIDAAHSLLELKEVVTESLNDSNGVYLIQKSNDVRCSWNVGYNQGRNLESGKQHERTDRECLQSDGNTLQG